MPKNLVRLLLFCNEYIQVVSSDHIVKRIKDKGAFIFGGHFLRVLTLTITK
jgi:hypothetical protein